jgi:uncharacterized membrane protein YadS
MGSQEHQSTGAPQQETSEPVDPNAESGQGGRQPYLSEDWWAILIGGVLLAGCLTAVFANGADAEGSFTSPLKKWLAKPGSWSANPIASFVVSGKTNVLPGLAGVFLVTLATFGVGASMMGGRFFSFARGFCFVFALGTIAYVLAGQDVVKHYNLGYALWALVIGLLISNTIGTPDWARPAIRTELFIKTGLVILGAEVLFSRLLVLGVPGIFVAWVVTPIVLITTFWFGQKILKIESPSLTMVIAADMSVCGVSAAIATAAACKAKKEELSLAIGMSLSFTVIMMVAMPAAIQAMGMSNVLGGAWMGGTIDATGAVAAAGTMLGEDALQVAATVKMIQNILIGVVAFCVAVFWVLRVEGKEARTKPSVMEIWRRFPKFILGFVAASVLFSLLYTTLVNGPQIIDAVIKDSTKTFRGWLFCLAFVSIGLETNFRELAKYFKGGKPLVLYVVGQSFNLCLTLFMVWLMFEKVFPHALEVLKK